MAARLRDVAVAGGGPAGLAAAAALAARGLSVVVLERRRLPADKACGEGLLPRAVEALEALGVLGLVAPSECSRLGGLRWISEDGATAEARFRGAPGLGVRRLALSEALLRRARAAGAEVADGCAVRSHRREADRVVLSTDRGEVAARLLVAADGSGSPVRRREGLDRPVRGPRRRGVRRHFALEPWSDAVEVHFAEGAEAYVTPAGAGRVGVALLLEEGPELRFVDLGARFPRLAARLAGAPADSSLAGAGPLRRAASARVLDRLVLLGDAGGTADPITGEGLSLALEAALLLARELPEALARGAGRDALSPLGDALRSGLRRHAALAGLILGMARRPRLRRGVIRGLAGHPRAFEALVARAAGWGSAPPGGAL